MIADPSAFFPFGRFGDIRELAPISMGLSGSGVYSVTTSRGEFILRVQGGDRAAWARSVAMQRLAAKEGIAPPVVHVVEDRAGVVYAKVEAITLGAVLAKPTIRPLALSDLAQRLAVLHAIPLSSGPEFTRELAESLWQSQVGRPGFPSWAIALGKRLVEACSMVAASPRRVFSHGDLHPANILWDGARIWLVDWERAGLAHPYSDLATLANFLTMPEDAALSLLGAQEGTAIDVDGQGCFEPCAIATASSTEPSS